MCEQKCFKTLILDYVSFKKTDSWWNLSSIVRIRLTLLLVPRFSTCTGCSVGCAQASLSLLSMVGSSRWEEWKSTTSLSGRGLQCCLLLILQPGGWVSELAGTPFLWSWQICLLTGCFPGNLSLRSCERDFSKLVSWWTWQMTVKLCVVFASLVSLVMFCDN